jgi:ABC-2 type transport system permease protein
MRVFKSFFLILNKYKGTVFIFFAVFMSMSLIMAKVNGGGRESSFQQDSLDIAIVDEDDGAMADQIREYFGTHDQVTKMKMDQDKITDALYWRRLDYVLVIPEGAGRTLAKGEIPELSCMKVPGYFDSAYFEAALQMYLQKMSALVKNGVDTDAAQQQLMKLQQKETKVHMASFVNKNQGDISTRFFLYVPYLFIAAGVSGIGLVLLRINGKEVRERTLPMKKRVMGLTAAILVYGLCLYLFVMVAAVIISGGNILTDARLPWFAVNIFTMLLFGISLGFFTGMTVKNGDAVNGVVNVTSLVLCFLGGVFVPRQFFGDGVMRVAKLFPTYWYVVNNEMIGAMKNATQSFVWDVLIQSIVSVGYALVLFAVTLVIVSAKRSSRQ